MRVRAERLAPLLFLLPLLGSQTAPDGEGENDERARSLIRRLVDRSTSEDEVASITMELVDSSGTVRERTATFSTKKKDAENDMRLIRFHSPPDLARSGILTIEGGSGDSDQWIYLPAYHASRRVASSNRSDTWMGTDFAYEDLSDPEPEQYRYRILGEERVGQLDATIVEAVPIEEKLKEESGYSKTVYWIHEEKAVAPRVDFYDRAGELAKRLLNYELEEQDGHLRWQRWEMHDLKRDHKTVLRFDAREIDQGLSDRHFTVRFLERGR